MKKILAKIKQKIEPKKIKLILNTFENLKKKLEKAIKQHKIKCEVFLGGSLKKNTMLSNNIEFDVFLRFDKSYDNYEISFIAEKLIETAKIKYKRIHGSRDYFKSKYKKIDVEIIPIYKINNPDDAVNITDISPLHVAWVTKRINNLGSDIRLAKQFCKAQGIYGAESYINGFSGYVLEILVIHYKSFENFIKNAAKWHKKTIIDTEKYYKDSKELLNNINSAKAHSPLILIDPVQKERNTAAAINNESYNKMIFAARQKLTENSFKIIKKDAKFFKRIAKKFDAEFTEVELISKYNNEDITGTKIKKIREYLIRNLEKSGFSIYENYSNTKHIWMVYSPKLLPKYYLHKGPMAYSNDENFKRFIEKHKDVKIIGEFLYAYAENKQRTMQNKIKQILKLNQNLLDKIKIKKL